VIADCWQWWWLVENAVAPASLKAKAHSTEQTSILEPLTTMCNDPS
jgi:hypothetical protein